jgi:hypothetical protein
MTMERKQGKWWWCPILTKRRTLYVWLIMVIIMLCLICKCEQTEALDFDFYNCSSNCCGANDIRQYRRCLSEFQVKTGKLVDSNITNNNKDGLRATAGAAVDGNQTLLVIGGDNGNSDRGKNMKKRSSVVVERTDSMNHNIAHSLTPSQLEERQHYCSNLAGMLPGFMGNFVRENPEFCDNLYTKHMQTSHNNTHNNTTSPITTNTHNNRTTNQSHNEEGIFGRFFNRIHTQGSRFLMDSLSNKRNDSITTNNKSTTTPSFSSITNSKVPPLTTKSVKENPLMGNSAKNNHSGRVRLMTRNPEIMIDNEKKRIVMTEETTTTTAAATTALSAGMDEIPTRMDDETTSSVISQPINMTMSVELDTTNLTSPPNPRIISITSTPMEENMNSSNIELIMKTSSTPLDTSRGWCGTIDRSTNNLDNVPSSSSSSSSINITIESITNDTDMTGNVTLTLIPSLGSTNLSEHDEAILTNIVEESMNGTTVMVTIDNGQQTETRQIDCNHAEEITSNTNDRILSSDERRIDSHPLDGASNNNMTRKQALDRLSVLIMELRLGFGRKRSPPTSVSSSDSPWIDSKSINDRLRRMYTLVEEIEDLDNTLSALEALKTPERLVEHQMNETSQLKRRDDEM